MSSGAAIATCTAVVQQLLQESLVGGPLAGALGTTPVVTALAPDRVNMGAGESAQLNVFCYNVSSNAGWSNRELPSHDRDGNRLTSAPAALDLHYVVSAYGNGNAHADVLLGHAALVIHGTRYLTRERVRALSTVNSIAGPLRALLAASGLDEQEEMIRLSPEPLSIDDISKLWSVFGERYRSSIAFTASVVLLRPDVPARQAKPVVVPNLRVEAVPIARIERVEPAVAEVGDQIVIHGHGLRGSSSVVRFGGSTDAPVPAGSTSGRIAVAVPTGARAGLSGVQVVHSVDFGPLSAPRVVADSNVAPLTVRPRIATTNNQPDITLNGVTVAGGVVTAGTITVRLQPAVGREQRVRFILHQTGVASPAQYVLTAPSRELDPAPASPTVTIVPLGIRSGDYLLAVEVDGVATSLTFDNATSTFVGPTFTIP